VPPTRGAEFLAQLQRCRGHVAAQRIAVRQLFRGDEAATQVGANTVFTIDGNDTVTLDNISKSSLAAGNFHFS
jgi:hypothetical protein